MTTQYSKRNEERTHEENQERSFYAASHRGDRDFNARMESARKASAMHEKRTGHPLNITEEAVMNEAPYDEVLPEHEKGTAGLDDVDQDDVVKDVMREEGNAGRR